MSLSTKDLLGIKSMTADEIKLILDTALTFKDVSERDIKKVPALRGKDRDQPVLRGEHAHAHVF